MSYWEKATYKGVELPDWEVSTLGELRSWRRGSHGRLLSCGVDSDGYSKANYKPSGSLANLKLHVLVLSSFNWPNPAGKNMVCHRNDIKADNRLSNLYWGDVPSNAADALKNGCLVGQADYSEELKDLVRSDYHPEITSRSERARLGLPSQRSLCEKYGMHRETIRFIVRGYS